MSRYPAHATLPPASRARIDHYLHLAKVHLGTARRARALGLPVLARQSLLLVGLYRRLLMLEFGYARPRPPGMDYSTGKMEENVRH